MTDLPKSYTIHLEYWPGNGWNAIVSDPVTKEHGILAGETPAEALDTASQWIGGYRD